MTEKDTGANFTVGFIFGMVVGAAIGFLYAPKPGREVREIIKHKAEEVREKATEVAEKTKETAAEARKRVEERLGHEEEA
ncbi:MAG: YtxH domain-containing protein [Chloroflexota bacterium]